MDLDLFELAVAPCGDRLPGGDGVERDLAEASQPRALQRGPALLAVRGGASFRAYMLKEQLRALYHLDHPTEAPAHLDAWLAWATRSKLKPFIRLARTLRRYDDGILAAIRLGLSNARLEGLHSRVRLLLLSHRSFGLHSTAPPRPYVPLLRRHHHQPAAAMCDMCLRPTTFAPRFDPNAPASVPV